MKKWNCFRTTLILGIAFCECFPGRVTAQVNVTTYHNDNARTGQNTQEALLTPANVNSKTFGKLFSVAVDGWVYAQPLYLSNVSISGGTHNVLYVATQHDSLYAIDADTGTIYWQVSLIPPGGSTLSTGDTSCTDIVPEVGITSTPVIDLATGTIYVLARSKLNGIFLQHLHAIDVVSSAEKFNGPVQIQATIPGTGDGGQTVTFNDQREGQRSGLLLQNGHVEIAWGSVCDKSPFHGWVMSYSSANLQVQEAAYVTTPNGIHGGIWMSGGGLTGDANFNTYFAIGDGTYDGATKADYGDTIVKLGPPNNGSFPVLDWFTPYNQSNLQVNNTDLGSGGILLLPDLPQGTPNRQLLVAAGKQGTLYVLDQNSMGKFCSSCNTLDTQIVQEIPAATTGIFGAPAYWNGRVYWGGHNDNLKLFSFNASGSGMLSQSPASLSSKIFNYPGPTPSISSNGTTNGILWALDNSTWLSACCQVLYAYDATNLANPLYNSYQAANRRDVPGGAVKFTTPTIANGKVYIGGQFQVNIYGAIAPPATVATPAFSPAPSIIYISPQSVAISDSTSGAQIYYTTDGSTPTSSSALYSAPIAVSATTRIKALAVVSGLLNSTIGSVLYTIGLPTPTFSPGPGSYTGSVAVTLADVSPGVTIYCTTDGSLPSVNSPVCTSLTLTSKTTLRAIAISSGFNNSTVATGTYTILQPTAAIPTFSPAPGTYPGSLIVTLSDTTAGASIRCTADGTTPTAASPACSTLNISSTTTVQAIAVANGFSNSVVGNGTYTLSSGGVVGVDFGSGFSSLGLQLNGQAQLNGNRLRLTDGGLNEASSAFFSSPLNVQNFASDFSFQLTNAQADGITFTIQRAGPTAIGQPGGALGYGGPAGILKSVAVKFDIYSNSGEGTSSVGLYINGTSPTVPAVDLSSSGISLLSGDVFNVHMVYNGASLTMSITDATTGKTFSQTWIINITSTVGGNAAYVGFTGGAGSQSAVQEILTWTHIPKAQAPFFSPASGSFASAQNVTLTDSTAGAQIYYTTDGTKPTTSSTLYTAPIPVNATTGIKAIAAASGYTTSNLSIGVYTITSTNAAAPAFSPAPGTYGSAQNVSLSDSTAGAQVYYTTDGSTPTSASNLYNNSSIQISVTTTLQAIAVASGFSNSAISGGTYNISAPPPAVTPIFTPAPGNYVGSVSVGLSDAMPGAQIFYTADGSTPTTASTQYNGLPIQITSTSLLQAIAVASGFSSSPVASGLYVVQ